MMLGVAAAILIVIVDQITKIAVASSMQPSQYFAVIQDVLHITYVQNRGMAFGMFADNRIVFMLPTVVLIGAVVWALVKFGGQNRILDAALGCILGGGVGNMIDRVARGYVVDFVDFCAFDFWKWVFNVADAAVVVGAFLFIIALITDKKLFSQEKAQDSQERTQHDGDNDDDCSNGGEDNGQP